MLITEMPRSSISIYHQPEIQILGQTKWYQMCDRKIVEACQTCARLVWKNLRSIGSAWSTPPSSALRDRWKTHFLIGKSWDSIWNTALCPSSIDWSPALVSWDLMVYSFQLWQSNFLQLLIWGSQTRLVEMYWLSL